VITPHFLKLISKISVVLYCNGILQNADIHVVFSTLGPETEENIKVTVDLQGCVPENHSYAHRLYYNHRKVYIIVKLIKCRIERNNFFLRCGLMVSARKPSNAKLTLFVKLNKLNYLQSCSQVQPNKLHNVNQLVIDYKRVRLFRYSDCLLRKSILKLAN